MSTPCKPQVASFRASCYKMKNTLARNISIIDAKRMQNCEFGHFNPHRKVKRVVYFWVLSTIPNVVHACKKRTLTILSFTTKIVVKSSVYTITTGEKRHLDIQNHYRFIYCILYFNQIIFPIATVGIDIKAEIIRRCGLFWLLWCKYACMKREDMQQVHYTIYVTYRKTI